MAATPAPLRRLRRSRRRLLRPLELACACVGVACLALVRAAPARADTPVPAGAVAPAASAAVGVVRSEWVDEARGRTVPVKLWVPAQPGPRPVVLLSHGLGGTREALGYLAGPWAEAGYLCVTLQHPGSDEGVWRDLPLRELLPAMRRAATDPRNALARAGDVRFVLDRLAALHADAASPLHGRVDLTRVAVVGHSFGAWTALAAGGRRAVGPGGRLQQDLSDPRVRCVVALSAPAAADEERERAAVAGLRVPTLHMTGTLDTSPINDTTPEERASVFRLAPGPAEGGAPQYLLVLDGGDHAVFAGEARAGRLRRRADTTRDPAFHALIRTAATRFLDAHLRDGAAARAWLEGEGLDAAAAGLARVERKVAPPAR